MIKEKLLEGARKLAEIVGITLGPRGRNVVLDRDGHPLITNDGVTIAREVKLHCPIEFMGAKIILQASSQTNQRAGDGTTSSIILAHEILRRGFEEVHSGTSPILLNDELLSLLPKIEALIKDIAIPLTNDKIQAIATNSSASDQLGQLVTQAFNIVGLDGIVTLEENNLGHTTLTHSDGAQFPLALAHPNFITDHKTLSSTLVSPHLKILDTPAKDLNALVPMLEHALETNTSLAIIAPDFSPDTLNLLLANRTRVRILPLKLNTHPSQHYTTLGDLKSISITKLTADMNSTRIHFRHENESEASVSFSARIETIKAQINSSTDDFEKYTLKKRLARLTSGIATISIGASTEIELKERKLRAEEAIAAVQSASTHGIVPGGGITYLTLAQNLKHKILSPALESITRQILINAGLDPDPIIAKLKPSQNPGETLTPTHLGYDAKTLEFCDMFERNIIDPAGVILEVTRNALSVSATLLTTDAAIIKS